MRQLVEEKENSEFKPVKLRLKIDLVSYPSRAEGLVNMYSSIDTITACKRFRFISSEGSDLHLVDNVNSSPNLHKAHVDITFNR